MSPLEKRIANLDSNRLAVKVEGYGVSLGNAAPGTELEAEVQRYAFNLGEAVGALEAAELMVGAAFTLLDRAEGGDSVRLFARRCYWGAIQASTD
jgi:hypothetical protein